MLEVFRQMRVWKGLIGMQIMQKVCGTYGCSPVPSSVSHLPLASSKICESCCPLEPTKRPSIENAIDMLKSVAPEWY